MIIMAPLKALLFVLTWAASVSALDAAGWKQQSIYQVITDRYATTNGSRPSCWIRNYCGGTFKGLQANLDYIQNMGFSAVWISPVIHQIEQNTTWGQAFHGYWGNDPYTLNEHFGTGQDLKDLSAAVHSRGMYLMVDVVINHLATPNSTAQTDFGQFPAPFNTPNAFHPDLPINYNNQTSINDGWLVDAGIPPLLPDINSEDPVVFGAIVQSVVDIVKNYSVDGIRLDTARQVPRTSLTQFQKAVGVYVTGEVFVGDYTYSALYQLPSGPLQSVLNYPMFVYIQNTFVGGDTFDYLASGMKSQNLLFADPNALLTFADNHDNSRFASLTGSDLYREMNAITFVLLTSGVPAVYYGFEQRMLGAYDPLNRAPLWTTGYNTSAPLYQYIAKLHQIRAAAAKAFGKAAFYNALAQPIANSDIYLAFGRGSIVVVVTNTGAAPNVYEPNAAANSTTHPDFVVPSSSFHRHVPLTDLLSCVTATAGQNGRFTSPATGGYARVWIATSAVPNRWCP